MLQRLMRNEPVSIPETTVATTVEETARDAVTILDVREQWEWDEGHIAGAVHIPLNELAARAGELEPESPVIAVCHAGQRSLYATAMLLDAGFASVRNLQGGMMAWVADEQPVER